MEFKGLGKNSAKMLWDKVKSTLFNKSVTDISISGKTVTIPKGDGTKSMQTTQDTNTTYGVVSKTADGLAPKLPNETGTTKYFRQDGTWAVPPDTTYNVFELDDNKQPIKASQEATINKQQYIVTYSNNAANNAAVC